MFPEIIVLCIDSGMKTVAFDYTGELAEKIGNQRLAGILSDARDNGIRQHRELCLVIISHLSFFFFFYVLNYAI